MASANESEATFSIKLDTDSGEVANEAAAELEELRRKIHGSNDAVKQMSASLRSLRGSTDEVKSAKAQLKALVESERNTISAANLALLKQGVTYEKLAGKARELAIEKSKLDSKLRADSLAKVKAQGDAAGNALKAAGGPVQELAGRFDALKGIVGGAGGAMGALTLAAAGTVAVLAALVAGVAAAGIALVKFIVGGADAARTLGLVREAFTGNAQNARNLGTQIDALSGKVSTSKEDLNKLANQLTRTRLSGQAIVDTFNLVGQASDAMGDEVGKQLQDIVTRGQITKRIQINPLELQGTGLQFKDIAGELAKQMRVGVGEAQAALFEGRVKLDDGAKALRSAVEKRFGEINARKLLSLDVQLAKFKERLGALTADVHLEPLLKGFDQLAKLFDSSTVSGESLKAIITIVGNGIGPAFQAVLPIAKGFIKGLIIGALDVGIAFLKLRNSIKKTFAGSELFEGLDGGRIGLLSAKVAVYALVGGVVALGASFALLGAGILLATAPIWGSALALYGLYKAAIWAYDKITGVDWKGLGSAIVDGLVNGLKAGASYLKDAVLGLADKVKEAFTGALGIKSPSKVFAQFGEHTAEGYAQGVEGGAARAADAAEALAPGAPSLGAGGGGGAPITLNVAINVTAGGGGQDIAKALADPSFLNQLTQAIEDMMRGAGLPTHGGAA